MTDKLQDIYGEVDEDEFMRALRERHHLAIDAERTNREQALEDLEFKAGEQWPDDIRSEREADGRPCLTINRMPQFIRQVTGDIRINKPAIKVRPVDDKADPELAEVFTGITRHIEQASKARVAYVTAGDNAASSGMGHFRIVTEYADDDVFDQDIRIKRMPNPFNVVWDPSSIEITREDARYCFVTDKVSKDEFKRRWPDKSLSEFEHLEDLDHLAEWAEDEDIRYAEYWLKVPAKKTIYQLINGQVVDELPLGMEAVKTREVDTYSVVQYIVSGVEVLEGPNEWAGKHIPIIPVIGEEINVGERIVRHGVIRFAKDPQRLYNYWRSTTAETIALSPKAPYIGTDTMFKGHEQEWARANRHNVPYLAFKSDSKMPGERPQREAPPMMSSALVQETGVAADDMKAVTGIYDAGLGARSNETSGKAIMARQMEGDVGSYVYMDNLSIAIGYAGEQLVDLIPKIYDTERVVRLLNEDDSEAYARVNQQAVDPETGEMVIINDLSAGRYDVVVNTGPSYSTKRMEAADTMMQFIQTAPQTAGLVMDLMVKNMDWPGADEIAERLKKTLPPGMIDDPENPQPQEPPPPDPKMMADMAKSQADVAKAEADIAKAQVETEGKQLDNETKKLELAAQLGEIQGMVAQTVEATLTRLLSPQPVYEEQPAQDAGFFME